MKLSADESRALAFVVGLIALSAGVRAVRRPPPVRLPAGARTELASLEAASESALVRQQESDRPLAPGERIDVNAASPDELARLPGVGPGLAQRIADERTRGGAFDSAADLRSVPGIGPKLLERLAPRLEFGAGRDLPRREHAAAPAGSDAPATPSWAEAPSAAAGPAAADTGGGRRRGRSGRGGKGSEPLQPGEKLDPNRATAAELERLPGVGPALAARIVAYRDSAGPFHTLAELDRVPGIGPSKLKRIAGMVDLPP